MVGLEHPATSTNSVRKGLSAQSLHQIPVGFCPHGLVFVLSPSRSLTTVIQSQVRKNSRNIKPCQPGFRMAVLIRSRNIQHLNHQGPRDAAKGPLRLAFHRVAET